MGSHLQQLHLNFYLDLDGQPATRPAGFSAAQDVEIAAKQSFTVKKIGSLPRSHIDLSLGANSGKAIQEWIQNTFDNKFIRKDGSIKVEDSTKKAYRTIDFYNALIESIDFPALDKASKSGDYLKLKIMPEILKFGSTDEKVDQKSAMRYGQTAQPFDPSHFKLTITGLATECAAVTKIDSIVIKQGLTADNVGSDCNLRLEPTKLDESNLVITLPMVSAKGFLDWHEKSIADGMAKTSDTKSGSLEYFAKGSSSSRFTLNFDGLGLVSAGASKGDASDAKRDFKCELYYSSVTLKAN